MNWDLIVEKREKSCLSLTMRNWVYGFEWRRTTKNRPDKEAKWRRRAPTAKAHPDASCFINRIQHSIHQNVTSPVHPWKINNTACLGKNICFANKITQQAHYFSCLLRSSHCPSPPSFPRRFRCSGPPEGRRWRDRRPGARPSIRLHHRDLSAATLGTWPATGQGHQVGELMEEKLMENGWERNFATGKQRIFEKNHGFRVLETKLNYPAISWANDFWARKKLRKKGQWSNRGMQI